MITVNILYKNPLFKNLSPYPRRDSQNSGCFKIKNLRVPLLPGSGSYSYVGWKWFRCGLACYENKRPQTLPVPAWLKCRKGRAGQGQLQKRISVRHYFVFGLGSGRQGLVGWGQGLAKASSNELVADTTSFLPGQRQAGVGVGFGGRGGQRQKRISVRH